MKPKVKRRTRTVSIEAEIRAKARQIMDDQMAEAMKAAALMIVGRKLDEIRTILSSAGLGRELAVVAQGAPYNPSRQPVVQQQTVEHACVTCGRESIRRTKPNQWNRTGSWYCPIHVGLAAQSEFEDARDNALLGPQAGPKPKPAVVQTHAPTVMRQESEPQPEVQIQPTATGPQDVPGAGSLGDAMAALGVVN